MDWRQLVSAAPYLYSIRLANPESSDLHHIIEMVGGGRFEPPLTESESALLPITTTPINGKSEQNRTVDNFHVKEVLCRLSYKPIYKLATFLYIGCHGVIRTRGLLHVKETRSPTALHDNIKWS